ncbi:MAG: cyclic nucleotide-binding domain-containing protein [Deltaproteobacteria bacterium]|nr:cyclic nucleotide-binding domain-containing protein [Deltaproteobacteria bacterium]
MADDLDKLKTQANRSLQAGNPAEAICYLAEWVSRDPNDRHGRITMAAALNNAGHPEGALAILRALCERLAHQGFLLPAIAVARHGLQISPEDGRLLQVLQGMHVRGLQAKAGHLAVPPPVVSRAAPTTAVTASTFLTLPLEERLNRATQIAATLPPAGPAAQPQPMPLFCELDTLSFLETVKHLRYGHVGPGTKLLEEGKPGDTLLVIVSGQLTVSKGGHPLAQLGAGAVLGEMAIITGAPRSATAVASEPVEYFELSRADLGALAKAQPKVAQALVEYCRRRLLANLMRSSPLFARFDEATRLKLLGRFQTISFAADETIIVQGEPATGLYVIASGEVDVRIMDANGESVTVAKLGPGEVFGEISLLRRQPTTAFVIAKNTVGALVLPTTDFQQVVQEHPEVLSYLQTITADRLKASKDAVLASDLVDADDLIVL